MPHPSAIYTPLPHEDSIRLLSLHFANHTDDEIHCDLKLVRRPQWKGRYTALSYVWGPEGDTVPIWIDGHRMMVRRNLFEYLRLWRPPRGPATIWIDALCIDQSSNDERGHQVRIMADIYRDAEQVYSWLGPTRDDSDWLFAKIAKNLKAKWLKKPWRRIQRDEHTGRDSKRMRDGRLVARAVAAVCARPYFSRRWILQELYVASRLRLLCGTDLVEGSSFGSLYKKLDLEYNMQGLVADRKDHVNAVTEIFDVCDLMVYCGETKSSLPSTSCLLGAVTTYQAAQCSVPHDKVFALIGLLPEAEPSVVRGLVDYDTPLAQLVVDIMHSNTSQAFSHLFDLSNVIASLMPDVVSLSSTNLHHKSVVFHISKDIGINKARWVAQSAQPIEIGCTRSTCWLVDLESNILNVSG